MDDTTRAVRSLYDRFPYPGVSAQLRADSFPWLLQSYVRGGRREGGLFVLDAGCGTGAGLLPVASLHPGAQVVGLDVSPGALAAAEAARARAGLKNLTLLLADITDLSSLAPARELTPRGFDVVYASGVVHHLSDPLMGLKNLRTLLAPAGVVSLMVYGRHGRAPVSRVAQALRRIWPPGEHSLEVRLARARALLAALPPGPVTAGGWAGAHAVSDAELADRYLHPNARTYTVEELLELVEAAGLRVLRWLEPRDWDARALLGDGEAADALEALPAPQRWAALELLTDRPSLSVVLARDDASPAPPLAGDTLRGATVAWNPQAQLILRERRYCDAAWTEGVAVRLRAGPERPLGGIQAVLARACREPVEATTLVERAREAVPAEANRVWEALEDLASAELVYAA